MPRCSHGIPFEFKCQGCFDEAMAKVRQPDVPVQIPAAVPVVDRGPWHITDWGDGRIAIQSNDFTHDVALEITGDFADSALKLAHAKVIAETLNAAIANKIG